jgi:hypothetical protein
LTKLAALNATAGDLLPNGDFRRGAEKWETTLDAGRSRVSILSLEESPYQHAIRFFSLPRDKDPSWALWLRTLVPAAIEQDDELVLRFWLRSPIECRSTCC